MNKINNQDSSVLENFSLNPEDFHLMIANQSSEVQTFYDYDGNEITSPPFHTHFTAASDTCVSDYYPNYKKAFEYARAVTYHQLGDALVYCCDVVKMTDTVRKIWEKTDRDLCIKEDDIPEEYYR